MTHLPFLRRRLPGLTLAAALGVLGAAFPIRARAQADVVLENAHVRYSIAPNGRNLAFMDRATGANHLARGDSFCASIRLGGRDHAVTGVRWEPDGKLALSFAPPGVTVILRVESRPAFLRLTVESVSDPATESLVFLNIPLDLAGRPAEAFGACALSLNLFTRVDALPALQSHLKASAERKFGLVGAQVAVAGQPMAGMLPALREALTEATQMPPCRVAGPWAHEVPFNHGSYLFNFGTLTETNVDEWIGMARSLGFTQVDNHGGGEFFRFGDLELNRARWPDGWDAFRRINTRLHDAGMGAILHTYAFFIDKRSRHVTPVPDARLDAFRTFTLAADLDAEATEVTVAESTAGLSTVTGFFEHNSVLLHVGDELITFGGFTREAPWRLTGLKRGAHGTKAAAHARGAAARHLKECFGLLVPNPESTLFEEIAARHAAVIDQCGFDGVYLDAIDGSSILRGNDECWYWADKFVMDIQKHLRKPVGMEMSAMWHHFWQYRTRWQAWDYPQRGHRRFLDLHAAAVNGGLMLPLHLGWWNFQAFQPPQVEPTFPDVMETVGARLVGWDAGISLTGAVDRRKLRSTPLFQRAVETLRTCEELRHRGGVDDATKALLREPGSEFCLVTNAAGNVRFQRQARSPHTLSPAEPWTLTWTVTNPYPAQPLRFRVEALMAASAHDATNVVTLLDPAGPAAADWQRTQAAGVVLETRPTRDPVPGGFATVLTATNAGTVGRTAAWARLQARFPAPRDLKGHEALGFWVEGDGQGQLLAIRLESPQHLAFGAVADRYLPIDFSGPRFVTLVETESERWSDYTWNDGKHPYNVYRESIEFGSVEAAAIWMQNLPAGRNATCRLGPVLALPLVPATVSHPVLTLNGQPLELDAQLTSGEWLDAGADGEVPVLGGHGEVVRTTRLQGPWPVLQPGTNQIRIACPAGPGPAPRLRVTVFARGPQLP